MRSLIAYVAGGLLAAYTDLSAQQAASSSAGDQARAGRPLEISPLAHSSFNRSYLGYWLGGGAWSRHHGDPPTENEGTWGWDYRGHFIPRKVDLLWWHGRRYQGGSGAYKTDGPHLPAIPRVDY